MAYEATLRDINSTTSSYYIPYATDSMDCVQLAAGHDRLVSQLREWQLQLDRYQSMSLQFLYTSTIDTIKKIMVIQTDKLNKYIEALKRCGVATVQTTTTDLPATGTGNGDALEYATPAGGSNTMLWLGAGGLALFALYRLNKRKRRA